MCNSITWHFGELYTHLNDITFVLTIPPLEPDSVLSILFLNLWEIERLHFIFWASRALQYTPLEWVPCCGKRWGMLIWKAGRGQFVRLQFTCPGSPPLGNTSPPNICPWPEGQHGKLPTLKTEPASWEKELNHDLERSLFLFSNLPTWHVAVVHFTSDYISHIALYRIRCDMMQWDYKLCIKMYQQPITSAHSQHYSSAMHLPGSLLWIQIKYWILLSKRKLN